VCVYPHIQAWNVHGTLLTNCTLAMEIPSMAIKTKHLLCEGSDTGRNKLEVGSLACFHEIWWIDISVSLNKGYCVASVIR
jgi:hypothetical protein